jgi:hypothetical protein
MRNKFSELYWGIFFLIILAFLSTFRLIRDFFNSLGREMSSPLSPRKTNWFSWLFIFLIVLLILMGLAIFLWHQTLKNRKKILEKTESRESK